MRFELDSVFEKGEDDEGNFFGIIKDPVSGKELGRVTASQGVMALDLVSLIVMSPLWL